MRALFGAAGVDFDQWKALTAVALKLDVRSSSLGRSPFRRRAGFVGGLIAQVTFYTLFGAAIAVFVWFSRDLFLVGTIAMTYMMFAIGMAVLVDHNSALASPLDYAILGFRPVTSRTYFAVRLTNVTWPPLRAAREERRGVERRAIALPPHEIGTRVGDRTGAPAFGELLHEVALFVGEVGRREHLEFIEQVADRVLATSGQTVALEPQDAPALAARRDLE